MVYLESMEYDYIRRLKSQFCKKCQFSSERRVSDMKSEVPGLMLTVTFCHWIFLFSGKASDADNGIIANFV